jgi:hypothetical protein
VSISFSSISLALLLFSNNLLAASINERLHTPLVMPSTQLLQLKNSHGNSRQIQLNASRGGEELKTTNRNIILIKNEDELSDLPQPLIERIRQALGGGGNLSNYHVFANFIHTTIPASESRELYIALIPKGAQIKNLILQLQWLAQGQGAHSQLRFVFDQDIKLIPQLSEDYPIYTLAQADLIYSIHLASPQGNELKQIPLKGLTSELANIPQILSTEIVARENLYTSHIENFLIEGLNSEQKNRVWLQALLSSDSPELGIFNAMYNSSVTHSLALLKSADERIKTAHYNPYSLAQVINSSLNNSLKRMSSLNDEFSFLVQAPQRAMTLEQIQNDEEFRSLRAYLPLLQSKEFEQVLRQFSDFIIANDIKTSELIQSSNYKRTPSHDPQINLIKNSSAWQALERIWYKNFPNRSPKEFLILLDSLHM